MLIPALHALEGILCDPLKASSLLQLRKEEEQDTPLVLR